MKKTRYYLKFGKSTSTFGTDPSENYTRCWFDEFSWEFEKANNLNVYLDEQLNQLYCYEKPSLVLRDEWGQTMMSMHSADVMIDYEKEVEVEETVTKLPSDNKYSNGMNWKNVGIKGANSRLRKPTKTKPVAKTKPPKKKKDDSQPELLFLKKKDEDI